MGIARLLVDVMVSRGMPRETMQHFWRPASLGLLIEGDQVRDFQAPFARPAAEQAN